MARAVKFERYGAIEELKVVDVPTPAAGPGRVVVEVVAAGINPGEAKIRTGALHALWPATFPSGEGSDFAGRIVEVGEGVSAFAVGDEVLGFTHERASHATHVSAPADQVTPKPAGLSWEVAGGLFVAGTTAVGATRALAVRPGETVVVAGASGGVGSIAVQLLRRSGAKVLGIASERNHEWLRSVGVVPVAYGAGLADRLRAEAPDGIAGFIDAFGGYLDLALELGVPAARIDTIVDMAVAGEYGVLTDGNAAAGNVEVLAELARLAASGELEVPVAAVYPLDEVQAAYRELEQGHTHGKIVLRP
ncbi:MULTISPECIES: NADP-dependent oxidoreductase [unclassified Nocardia]|uniref:NADP-dependent oxidoreductase n=1 Tax=unclassified Nocardia TaxID=2637762 RepID=UPI001CE49334|nr:MULTISPECIES: NADP-dependent oxidoreductase [unclassified Nocardia]